MGEETWDKVPWVNVASRGWTEVSFHAVSELLAQQGQAQQKDPLPDLTAASMEPSA